MFKSRIFGQKTKVLLMISLLLLMTNGKYDHEVSQPIKELKEHQSYIRAQLAILGPISKQWSWFQRLDNGKKKQQNLNYKLLDILEKLELECLKNGHEWRSRPTTDDEWTVKKLESYSYTVTFTPKDGKTVTTTREHTIKKAVESIFEEYIAPVLGIKKEKVKEIFKKVKEI
jgi:hypothetical protein